MKVLMICTEKLPVPAIRGGAIQTYIDGALPTLKQQHSITVLGRNDHELPNKETKDGIHYVRVEGGLFERYRREVVQFLKTNSENYDVIHIFNRPRLVNQIRELYPDARIVLSMHNDMFKPEKISAEEGAAAVKNVDKIVTISNYIGSALTEFFPEAAPKLQTIYSGVDLDRFAPSYSKQAKEMREKIRQEHNLTGKKVILYAGRMSPNKGSDILVRAMPAIAENHPDAALVIMGSKWFSDDSITDYIAYVRALAERLPVPVIQTGFVSPDHVQDWFAASDVFVCTSRWQEPLARVHYEAMAAALPIITTDRGGNKEVMEDHKNGIVIQNPEDTNEFAKHISYLLSKPDIRTEMGRYGRQLAEKHYTWDRVVQNILSVWENVEHHPSDYVTYQSEGDNDDFTPVLQQPKIPIPISHPSDNDNTAEETKTTDEASVTTEVAQEVANLVNRMNRHHLEKRIRTPRTVRKRWSTEEGIQLIHLISSQITEILLKMADRKE